MDSVTGPHGIVKTHGIVREVVSLTGRVALNFSSSLQMRQIGGYLLMLTLACVALPLRAAADSAPAELAPAQLRQELRTALMGSDREALEGLCQPALATAQAQEANTRDAALWFSRAAECFDSLSDSSAALEAWRAVVAHYPSARQAAKARARIRALEPRVAQPSATGIPDRLDIIRRQRLTLGSDEAIAQVQALLDEAQEPPDLASLYLWLGDEYLDIRKDYDASRASYLEVIELEGLEPRTYYRALNRLVDIGLYSGETGPPARDVDRFIRLHPEISDAANIHALRAWAAPMAWRGFVLKLSLIGIALFFVFALSLGAWRVIRAPKAYGWNPLPAIALLAWLMLGSGFFAEQWDTGFFMTFAIGFLLVSAIHVLSTSAAAAQPAGDSAQRPRIIALSVLTGWATIAAFYLSIHLNDMHILVGL